MGVEREDEQVSKSKCEIELEKMTDERDHWRRLAKERSEENRQLHNQVERQAALAGSFLRGTITGIDDAYAKLQDERDSLKARVDELHRVYQKPILTTVSSHPDQTYVSAVLLIYTPDDPDSLHSAPVPPVPYDGTAEQAQSELLMPLMHVLTRMPTPEDIGHKNQPPLLDGEVALILSDLFDPTESPETFDERRRSLVDRTWRKVDRDHPYTYDARDFKDGLNKIIKRAGEERQKRIEREIAYTNNVRIALARYKT